MDLKRLSVVAEVGVRRDSPRPSASDVEKVM